jgi:hypothetical protein
MAYPRVAVVTDSMSRENWFPKWYSYYAEHFGEENIFIHTFDNVRHEFSSCSLKNLRVIGSSYNDDLRMRAINESVYHLLSVYDVVLRVDTDEFVVADPNKWKNIRDFVLNFDEPYMTARGFDVLHMPGDPQLDFSRPILMQRQHAFALHAMNKTCITRTPMRWGRGFHYCSRAPLLGDLFLFHTKRADISSQQAWAERMIQKAAGDEFSLKYFQQSLSIIEHFHLKRSRMPCESDATGRVLYRDDFMLSFLDNVKYNKFSDLYEGSYRIEETNVILPDIFRHIF